MKKNIFFFAIAFSISLLSNAQTKEIDVTRHNESVALLNDKNNVIKQQTLDSILKNPNF